jgi:hypothetical protein
MGKINGFNNLLLWPNFVYVCMRVCREERK